MTAVTRRQSIGLVLLTLMWGLNWPIMKLALRELGPLHFRALTMGLGALAMAAYFGALGLRLWPRGGAEWRAVLVLGLPNILGWHALSIILEAAVGCARQCRDGRARQGVRTPRTRVRQDEQRRMARPARCWRVHSVLT